MPRLLARYLTAARQWLAARTRPRERAEVVEVCRVCRLPRPPRPCICGYGTRREFRRG